MKGRRRLETAAEGAGVCTAAGVAAEEDKKKAMRESKKLKIKSI